jgi:hypothetical protein
VYYTDAKLGNIQLGNRINPGYQRKWNLWEGQYTWQDNKTNQYILLEVKINQVVKKIKNYGNKWIQHFWRMNRLTAALIYEILAIKKKKTITTIQKACRFLMWPEKGLEAYNHASNIIHDCDDDDDDDDDHDYDDDDDDDHDDGGMHLKML